VSKDIKVVHVDPEGSCPGPPRGKGCGHPQCRRILIEWVKGPHDGLSAFICQKELVRKYPARIMKAAPRCHICRQEGCRAVLVQSTEGPLPGARAWFCIREVGAVADESGGLRGPV
jgi:hypothetical protein